MQLFNPRAGIIFMVLAMLVNSSKDGIAKLLAENYTPLSILLIQFIATSIVLYALIYLPLLNLNATKRVIVIAVLMSIFWQSQFRVLAN